MKIGDRVYAHIDANQYKPFTIDHIIVTKYHKFTTLAYCDCKNNKYAERDILTEKQLTRSLRSCKGVTICR